MTPSASADLQQAQSRRVAVTSALLLRQWQQADDDLLAWWPTVVARLVAILAAARLGAARDGAAMVPLALQQQGFSVAAPDGTPALESVAGVASDGRPLDSLLYGAVVKARSVEATSLDERVSAGSTYLTRVARTQVADAARTGSAVAVAARQGVGWVRMVTPPCCKDCAVLAGRIYRWSTGFQRHPNCDCQMLPTTVANPDPPGVTVPIDQITGLTAGERRALDDGADLGRVVNANRGRSANRMTTTALSRRGQSRLTPDGILRVSATREEAVQRLRDNGYLM